MTFTTEFRRPPAVIYYLFYHHERSNTQKVADENAYYQMRYEKDKPIKTAFIKGLAQVDELINNSKYNSTNQLKFISKNIHWLNVIGECQHVEDTQ